MATPSTGWARSDLQVLLSSAAPLGAESRVAPNGDWLVVAGARKRISVFFRQRQGGWSRAERLAEDLAPLGSNAV